MIDLDAIEEAIALAKRQRAGGTAYSFDTVSIDDMEALVAAARVGTDIPARFEGAEIQDVIARIDMANRRHEDAMASANEYTREIREAVIAAYAILDAAPVSSATATKPEPLPGTEGRCHFYYGKEGGYCYSAAGDPCPSHGGVNLDSHKEQK